MAQAAKSDNELHNVNRGDYLSCQACGHIIWAAPLAGPSTFQFAPIRNSYFRHLQKCFGLKKLVVKHHLLRTNPQKFSSPDQLDRAAETLITGVTFEQIPESSSNEPEIDLESIPDSMTNSPSDTSLTEDQKSEPSAEIES